MDKKVDQTQDKAAQKRLKVDPKQAKVAPTSNNHCDKLAAHQELDKNLI